MLGADHALRVTEHDELLEQVLQLAHVPRPVIRGQDAERVVGDLEAR